MRILQTDLCSGYPLARAGGHRTIHSLLLEMARGASVKCMSLYPRRGLGSQLPEYDPRLQDFESLGIRKLELQPERWIFDCGYSAWAVESVEAEFGRSIESWKPQVVWSNCFLSMPLLLEARARGLGALWYIHDSRPSDADLRRANDAGILLLAVSQFIAARIRRATGASCEVVYPLIREKDYVTERAPDGFVTLINPRPVKGYETFLAIAAAMPETPFLVVEAWPLGDNLPRVEAELARFGNVQFVRQLADARAIYRQTRLLLAPSTVEEGGPRVIREAQLNGIPALGSRRGGVPEMIGDGGAIIDDYANPEAWIAAIREILDDPKRYEQLTSQALANARREELQSDVIVRRFLSACEQAAGRRQSQSAT